MPFRPGLKWIVQSAPAQAAATPTPANLEWLPDNDIRSTRPRPFSFDNDASRGAIPIAATPKVLEWQTDNNIRRLKPPTIWCDNDAARGAIPIAATPSIFDWSVAEEPTRVRRPLARLDETAFVVSPLVTNPITYVPVDEVPARPRRRSIPIDGDAVWSVLLPTPPPFGWLSSDQAISLRRRASFDAEIAAIAFNVPPPLVNIGWLPTNEPQPYRKRPGQLDPQLVSGTAATFTIGWDPTITPSAGDGGGDVGFLNASGGAAIGGAVLSTPATILSIAIYVFSGAAGNVLLGIYDNTGASGQPGALKASCPSAALVSGWNTVNISVQTLLPAGTYWLMFTPNSNTPQFGRVASGFQTYAIGGQSFALPSTAPTMSSAGSEYAIYATFLTAPVPSTAWLTADDPVRVRKNLSRLDETAFIAPFVAAPAQTPSIIWWIDERPIRVPVRYRYLDPDPVAGLIPIAATPSIIGWSDTDRPRVRRLPIWFDKDAAAGAIPIAATPSIIGWLPDNEIARVKRPPLWFDADAERGAIPPATSATPSILGWLPDNEIQRVKRPPAWYERDPTRGAIPIAATPANLEWQTDNNIRRLPPPRLSFDNDASRGAIPIAATPSVLGWQPDNNIQRVRKPLYFDIEAVRGAIPPTTVSTPSVLGWMLPDNDIQKVRRPPLWFDKEPALGLIPIAATPSVLGWLAGLDQATIQRRRHIRLDDGAWAPGGLPTAPSGWLDSADLRAIPRRPTRLDEAAAPFFQSAVPYGWLTADYPRQRKSWIARLDETILIVAPTTISFGWLAQENPPVIQRRRIRLDLDAAGVRPPPIVPPPQCGWLPSDRPTQIRFRYVRLEDFGQSGIFRSLPLTVDPQYLLHYPDAVAAVQYPGSTMSMRFPDSVTIIQYPNSIITFQYSDGVTVIYP